MKDNAKVSEVAAGTYEHNTKLDTALATDTLF